MFGKQMLLCSQDIGASIIEDLSFLLFGRRASEVSLWTIYGIKIFLEKLNIIMYIIVH